MNVSEAKAKLSELLAAAEAGEDVFIAQGDKPVVRLVSVAKKPFPFGCLSHLVPTESVPDFDEPIMTKEKIDAWENRF